MPAAIRPNSSTQAFDSNENQSNQCSTLFTATSEYENSTPDTFYINQKSDPGDEAKWKGVARLPWMVRIEESEECRFAHQ